jgi:hypothetical protein
MGNSNSHSTYHAKLFWKPPLVASKTKDAMEVHEDIILIYDWKMCKTF